ncbi:late competence development ComFB family protein [Vibrio zhugei]|uniref:Late competence development ComFB family protein n=1 Tax=Vibrio zhugei TaxID=2479546 RepID=A0ABV7CAG2_9VIBR|nr:late competence development ComFB family protein [Vibrio zhugei]
MNIHSGVHNYMEILVGQALVELDFQWYYHEEQLADVACLALNQLRPVYIRHDIDFLSALTEARLVILKESAKTALLAAESMIIHDRRQSRDNNPVVMPSRDWFAEDQELEWYETPILKTKEMVD